MGEREFNIKSLEDKIQALKSQESEPQGKSLVWKRFDDLIGKMSDDQKSFVAAHEKVIGEKQKMMQVFEEWIFEKHKDEFALIPAFAGIAQEYVDAVASTAQEFGQNAAGLKKENDELRQRVAELEKAAGGDAL